MKVSDIHFFRNLRYYISLRFDYTPKYIHYGYEHFKHLQAALLP